MNIFIYFSLASVLLSGAATYNSCNKTQIEPTEIIWRKGKKLDWKDFQRRAPEEASDFSALSNINIGLTYKDKGEIRKVKTYCIFTKNKSWVKVRSDEALKHEQLHFDIGEYSRRILQIKIDSIITINKFITASQIKNLLDNSDVQHDEMQLKYDDETDHGLRRIMQIKWEEEIEKSLKQTE